MNYTSLSGAGALLLATSPAKSKKARQELVVRVNQWLSVLVRLDGDRHNWPEYQRIGLQFLSEKLRDKMKQLNDQELEEE